MTRKEMKVFEMRRNAAEEFLRKNKKLIGSADLFTRYRKRFGTNHVLAVKELKLLGVEVTSEMLDFQKAELVRFEKHQENKRERRREKAERKRREADYGQSWQDDTFYFIAGYTSGGAPYGTTWEEMGLEPWEEYDEAKVRAYQRKMASALPFDEVWEEDFDTFYDFSEYDCNGETDSFEAFFEYAVYEQYDLSDTDQRLPKLPEGYQVSPIKKNTEDMGQDFFDGIDDDAFPFS